MRGVEEKLVSALRRRREATIADLVTDTALPKIQVEQGMRTILHEYVGHLKATESGELLYSFPTGMRNQVRGFGPGLRRNLRRVGRAALKALGFLFKVWIAAMLVGYFAIFVALFVLAIVASIAASMAGRSQGGGERDRGRGGFGGFYLVTRIIDLLFLRLLLGRGPRRNRGEPGRPLHRTVFGYVFGDKDPEPEWRERERATVLRHIRSEKGVITLEELIRITGSSRADAERTISELLMQYEGEPEVTDRGTILYVFPELLRTRADALRVERGAALERRPLILFSDNKPKANRWVTFFNAFNLVFGGYFLYYSATVVAGTFSPDGPAGFFLFVAQLIQKYLGLDPLALLGFGLGAVPVVFSVFFFLVPLVRRMLLERRNERIREHNVRRDVYGTILARPEGADAEDVVREAADHDRHGPSRGAGGRRRGVPRDLARFVKREIDELAAAKRAEVEAGEGGRQQYRFTELAEEIKDLERYRASVDLERYDVGKTVFDSAE
jgi:hypothetical protein